MQRSTKYAVLLAIFSFLFCGSLLIKGSITQVPTGTWALAGNMAAPRSGAATVLLQDGRLLITGGASGAGILSSVEVFDPSGNFSAAPPMNYARSKHTAIVLQDGRVLVAGGVYHRGRAVAHADMSEAGVHA